MLPDYSVKHVPGLYPADSNAGCCRRGDRRIVSKMPLSVVAAQQNLVRYADRQRQEPSQHRGSARGDSGGGACGSAHLCIH